jgi:hypothetical protein
VLTFVGWNAKKAYYHLAAARRAGETFTKFHVLAYTFDDAVRVADAAERAGIESQLTKGKAKNIPTPVRSMTIELTDAELRELLMVERDSLFAYMDSPIFCKGVALRGLFGEEAVRRALERRGYTVKAPLASKDVNGRKRKRGSESYDLRIVGKDGGKDERVEVKLARVTYNPYTRRWEVHFAGVKGELHDRLFLVVELPDSYRVFEWGGQNVSTNGQQAECKGNNVVVCGSRGETDFAAATKTVLQKMRDAGNTPVATFPFEHEDIKRIHETTTAGVEAYAASPLSVLSAASRGAVGEAVVRRVLARLGTYAVVAADSSLRVDGRARGENQAEYDLGLVEVATGARLRAEVKMGRGYWNTYGKCYLVHFPNVKPGLFDVLFIVLELPSGLHVLQLDAAATRVSKAGVVTEACGGTIVVSAPKDEEDLLEVETMMLKKLCYMHGAEYLAFLPYAEGCTFKWAVEAVRDAM